MVFLAPIWLLLLLPWAGVAAWVLLGRSDFARVSSTLFWEPDPAPAAVRRGIRRPPWPIVAILVAMLLAVLAAGKMAIYQPGRDAPFTLVLDHGALTAAGLHKDPELANRIVSGRSGSVEVIGVPSADEILTIDQRRVAAVLRQFVPSGVDTGELLPQVIRRELLRTEHPIVVVTSQPIAPPTSRVTIVAPAAALRNAGIEAFAAVETPSPQAMVRVWNGFASGKATLRVGPVETAIDLPPAGASKDYFVDLPGIGQTLGAELLLPDDLPGDNVAWLAKQGAWPRVEARSALPPAVGRMIEIYSRERVPGVGGQVVAITADPAINAQITLASGPRKIAGGIVRVEPDHPVTGGVDWNAVLKEAALADPPAGSEDGHGLGQGKVLLSVGAAPAIIEWPGRWLWMGFDLTEFARRPDFVVFFTNAIDYVGQGLQRYASEPPRALGSAWQRIEPAGSPQMHAAPGIYRNGTELRAQWIPAVRPPVQAALGEGIGLSPRPAALISIVPALLLASVLLTLVAVLRLTRN